MTKKIKDKAPHNTKLSATEKEKLIKKTDKSSHSGKRKPILYSQTPSRKEFQAGVVRSANSTEKLRY